MGIALCFWSSLDAMVCFKPPYILHFGYSLREMTRKQNSKTIYICCNNLKSPRPFQHKKRTKEFDGVNNISHLKTDGKCMLWMQERSTRKGRYQANWTEKRISCENTNRYVSWGGIFRVVASFSSFQVTINSFLQCISPK